MIISYRLILFITLFFSSQLAMAFTYTVKISEADLQKQVDAMMPIEKNKRFFKVVLSNPKIELIEGRNEIGIFSHIELDSKLGIKGAGKAKITGALSYNPDLHAFFFKNSKIEKLEIDRVADKHIVQIKPLIQTIAGKLLEKQPVYRLKQDNLKHKFARAVLQSVSVKDKKLLLELSML